MPLRYTPTGAALRHFPFPTVLRDRRFFHASYRLDADVNPNNNHYETLNVHPDASPAEIKRSFYHLSKRHHPDHNPTDPHAPSRFMRISEAYATLGHADKRARYDRDILRRNPYHGHPRGGSAHPHATQARGGSYHSSTGPAGGRPASGLSRRRSAFQGPPPSFFRSGGWGAHGAKRRAAHDESTGGYGSGAYGTNSNPNPGGHPSSAGSHRPPPPPPPPPPSGGMGPGQDPYGHGDDVPHFDRAAHERAQRRGDERRAQKIAREKGVKLEPDTGTTLSFFAVAMILAAVVSGPFVISWFGSSGGNGNRGNGGPHGHGTERERERERRAR